jgi:predicted DCC family thiol-disulfide oxidoreductase YuxK
MQPVVVYDGDCGICEASGRWIIAHIPAVDVVSHHQYGLAHIGSVWFVTDSGRLEGAEAISAILKLANAGVYRTIGVVIGLPGVLFIAGLVYSLIARNRRHISRLLGMNACGLPPR